MKVCVVLGTRPEIIKMAPVIKELKNQGMNPLLIHTNQHYSQELDAVMFKDLNLDKPKYNLHVGSGIHGLQTGRMLQGIEEVFVKEKPEWVLVHGDTNTTLSGALAASKLGIKVAHVEAGLRSHDRSMPEEINRVLVDHITDFCCAPTEEALQNLLKEGIPGSKINVTGNTIVDAVLQNVKLAEGRESLLKKLGVDKENYVLVTAHRQENVDNKEKLESILNALDSVSQEHDLPILYPIHPRTKKRIEEFDIEIPERIKVIKPVGYLDFLYLQKHARIILTDSGGIQEEACILGVPCVTLRENTERPETLDVGANVLAGTDAIKILKCVRKMLESDSEWNNPFGDGNASTRIVKGLL